MLERMVGLIGVAVMIGLVFAASRNRGAVRWKHVIWGVGLQFVLAVLLLRTPGVSDAFGAISNGVKWFVSFGDEGAKFIFGGLAGDSLPVTDGGREVGFAQLGTILLLKILPTIIFVASAMSVLFHLGVLQILVRTMAGGVRSVLHVSGAESLAAAANVFMGMTEAPLLIRPYMKAMTPSELFAVMAVGFATISGALMAVYHDLFGVDFSFMLAASVISAPAALYLTKIYMPEMGTPETLGTVTAVVEKDSVNVIDAAARGASTGLKLALNVGAMLLAFAAGLKLVDSVLAWVGSIFLPAGADPLGLGRVLGWILMPVAWLLGTPARESAAVGQLLGIKVALNEFFAYQGLSEMTLSPRARGIATFALCGFANFGSIAIQLGGLGGLVPDRRSELARYGVPAMMVGAIANCTTAAIAGLVGAF